MNDLKNKQNIVTECGSDPWDKNQQKHQDLQQ